MRTAIFLPLLLIARGINNITAELISDTASFFATLIVVFIIMDIADFIKSFFK